MNRKVSFKEAIFIANLRNYEKKRLKLLNELPENEKERNKALSFYHASLYSTVDEYIINPFLKQSVKRERNLKLGAFKNLKLSCASLLWSALNTVGTLMLDAKGMLFFGACSFGLGVAAAFEGVFQFIMSRKESKNRIDVIDSWNYDRENLVDLVDFCDYNNIRRDEDPFDFELKRIGYPNMNDIQLRDPFEKKRFRKDAKQIKKDGVPEEEFKLYKKMYEESQKLED